MFDLNETQHQLFHRNYPPNRKSHQICVARSNWRAFSSFFHASTGPVNREEHFLSLVAEIWTNCSISWWWVELIFGEQRRQMEWWSERTLVWELFHKRTKEKRSLKEEVDAKFFPVQIRKTIKVTDRKKHSPLVAFSWVCTAQSQKRVVEFSANIKQLDNQESKQVKQGFITTNL